MIAAVALLFLAQADASPAATPAPIVEEGTNTAVACNDPNLTAAKAASCAAAAAVAAAGGHSPDCDSPFDHPEVTVCRAPAAIDPPEPDDDCDNPQDVQRMNFCASLGFSAAEAALGEQWEITAQDMRDRDGEIDRDDDQQPGHYETLLEGQRGWLAFREAQCRSESFLARGGATQPVLKYQCLTYLTELRIQQLRNLSAGPES